jgi:iron complex outermembrane receptor protein
MKWLTRPCCILIILSFCLLITFPVEGMRVKGDPIPLSEVLKKLAALYKINFLYEESAVVSRKVEFDEKTTKGIVLDEVLTGVLRPAGLGWARIDAKNISVFAVRTAQLPTGVVSGENTPILTATDTLTTTPLPLPGIDMRVNILKEVKIISSNPLLQKKSDRYSLNVEKSIIAEGATVADMVTQLPGVQLDKDGKLVINGKPGTGIFIDGKPTLLALDAMLSSSVEKIELINNPSAKYEAAGSGGIINIIRKKNRKDGLNGTASVGYGRGKYNRDNGSFNAGYKNERFNLFLNTAAMAEKTYINADALSVLYTGQQKTGTLDAHNFHIRRQRTFVPEATLELYLSPVSTLSLSGNAQIRNTEQHSDSYTNVLNQNDGLTHNIGFKNNQNDPVSNYSSGAHLAHQIDTNGRGLTADADYSNYRNLSVQDITNTTNGADGSLLNRAAVWLDQNNRLQIYAAKADYVHPLKGQSKLEIGVKSSYVDSKSRSNFFDVQGEERVADPSRSNNFNYQENINAAYLLYSGRKKAITYQAGLRLEQTSGRGNQLITSSLFKQEYTGLFPSVTVKYQADDQQAIQFSAGRKIDRPAYQDLNPLLNFVNSTAYIQGDPNLKPQMAWNNEVAYSYNHTIFITLANSWYTNYMTYWVFPEQDPKNAGVEVVVSRPVNIDRAAAYSANGVIVKKINQWWTTSNSFTLFYNRYNGVVNNYTINNQGMLSFMFSANQSLAISNRLSAEGNFRYAGKSQIGSSLYLPNSNLSLGVKTLLFADRASLTFNVTDLFHNQNYRWTSQTGSIIESRDVRIDSRVYKLNFSYRFGGAGSKRITTSTSAEEEKNRARSN